MDVSEEIASKLRLLLSLQSVLRSRSTTVRISPVTASLQRLNELQAAENELQLIIDAAKGIESAGA
jgi:hypothetical protein